MIIFMFLAQFVLSTCCLLSETNSLPNQQNAHSWAMRHRKRVSCVMILKFKEFVFLGMLSSLTTHIFFNKTLPLPFPLILCFSPVCLIMKHMLSLILILSITCGVMRRQQVIPLPIYLLHLVHLEVPIPELDALD